MTASKYIVTSVPHSGTRFCMKLLQVLDLDPERSHISRDSFPPADYKIIIPARDPAQVYLSRWQRRKHAEALHYKGDIARVRGEAYYIKRFPQQYGAMAELMATRKGRYLVIPVDTAIDPGWWTLFTAFLEIPHERLLEGKVLSFIHAWAKVGSFKNKNYPPPGRIPPEIETIRTEWNYFD